MGYSSEESLTFTYDIAQDNSYIGQGSKALLGKIFQGISKITKWITGDEELAGKVDGVLEFKGFGGFMTVLILRAASGDIVSALAVCIILGQTCALIFSYTKRLFYCMLLSLLAPLVIAVDVIKKSV